jgi:hypothetical protein
MVELHVVQADDIKREKGTRPSSSEFFPSRIPEINFFPSRIRIKEFKYFKPKILFLNSRNMILVVHPGSAS